MRLDQLIDRIDRLGQIEKLALISRLAYQLDLKVTWLTDKEILEKKIRKKQKR